MTVEYLNKICQKDKAIESDIKCYYAPLNKSIPKYIVVEKKPRDEYVYYHYNEKLNEYVSRTFLWTESVYLSYLFSNKSVLKDILESGKLYTHIMKKAREIDSAIEQQIEKWELEDEEITLAKKMGDEDKADRLRNNLRARATELIYKNIISF